MAFSTQQGAPHGAPTYNPNYRGGRGRNNNYRGRGDYSSRGRGFAQHQTAPSNQGDRPTCQICGRPGHTAIKCYNRFNNNYQSPQAYSSLRGDDKNKNWIYDSGATAHVTPSATNLQYAHPYEGTDAVMIGDGAYLPITHVGSTISSPAGIIQLNEVLVCPDIQKSLLSVSKLCDDMSCGVFFDATNVYVIDLHKAKVVTKGPRSKGLYILKNQELEANFSDRHISTSEDVWHLRLGHSSSKVLQQLKSSKEIEVNKKKTASKCEPCQMGKSPKLQFFQSQSHVVQPLYRIHYDLWGPSPIMSKQGFRYYAVLVDDFTRFSWFYPLQNKSDFYSVFVQFKILVETQFNSKIKEFQSDGGGEFVNHQMKQFLQTNGTIHRVSCPYTPEQNGLAERKHRHYAELGLAMMYQSHLPLHHWVEAFSTASYIINLLPSEALKNISPFEKRFQKKPDYSSLRAFGTACYLCLHSVTEHKFEPRSLQCVFVGYSMEHKGYRCLYPPTGRVYITRHAVFDEDCFPFKQQFKPFIPTYDTRLLKAWQLATRRDEPVKETPQISRVLPTPPASVPTVENPPPTHVPTPPVSPQPVMPTAPPVIPVPVPVDAPAPVENTHQMQTRSKAGIQKPNTRYSLVASKGSSSLPKNIHEAMQHPGWNNAVMEEIRNIHMLHTWDLVPPEEDMHILSNRWVYTEKIGADGTVKRL